MKSMTHKTLTSEVEIAAYVHRTRMRMLAVLRDGPATVSKIAERLGVHPANLTRHMRILEDAGLAKLIEKRDTGRNLEKWYAATATSFDVAPDAGALKAPHKIALAFARSDLSAALSRLGDDEARPVNVLVLKTRLSPDEIDALEAELAAIAGRYGAEDGEREGNPYHLMLAFYPGEEGALDEDAPPVRLKRRSPKRGKS